MRSIRAYLFSLPIILAVSACACASEKEMPERGLDFVQLYQGSSDPYSGRVFRYRRIYSDDTLWTLVDVDRYDTLESVHIEGVFSAAQQILSDNQFVTLENLRKKMPESECTIFPAHSSTNIRTRIDGHEIWISSDSYTENGCADGGYGRAFVDLQRALVELME